MATRLAWWTIPATVVVLVRVVTLEPASPRDGGPSLPAAGVETEAVVGGPGAADQVVLRDASGARSGPLGLSTAEALVLRLPPALARRRVDFTLRRYLPHGAEPSLWLHGNPRVRADATMPILGLPAGRYALEIAFGDGDERRQVVRDVTVPGTLDLTR